MHLLSKSFLIVLLSRTCLVIRQHSNYFDFSNLIEDDREGLELVLNIVLSTITTHNFKKGAGAVQGGQLRDS